MKLLPTNLCSVALLVLVWEEGTDKDAISDLMVVGAIKLLHGGQISFLKEVYFCIRKELISQRKDISLYYGHLDVMWKVRKRAL